VVGIDRDPLPQPMPGARVLSGDIFTTTDDELLGELQAFDVCSRTWPPTPPAIRGTDQARSADLFEEALARPSGCWRRPARSWARSSRARRASLRKRMQKRVLRGESGQARGLARASTEVYLVGKGFAPARG
jgi:hypothetical protein